jgi:hypothetical protein
MKNTPKLIYVSYYGQLWRMSERKYRALLRAAAQGAEWHLPSLGKMVAEDVQDVSYLTADRAAQVYHARYKCFPTLESCRDAKP